MKELELTCRVGKEISEDELRSAAAKALGVGVKSVGECRLVRRSVDARGDVIYRLRYQVCTAAESLEDYAIPEYHDVHDAKPVIVAGAGPAGMFAALHLLMRGLKPVIIERGKDVHARKFDVAKLSDKGVLNPDSNYCFGEGAPAHFPMANFSPAPQSAATSGRSCISLCVSAHPSPFSPMPILT